MLSTDIITKTMHTVGAVNLNHLINSGRMSDFCFSSLFTTIKINAHNCECD